MLVARLEKRNATAERRAVSVAAILAAAAAAGTTPGQTAVAVARVEERPTGGIAPLLQDGQKVRIRQLQRLRRGTDVSSSGPVAKRARLLEAQQPEPRQQTAAAAAFLLRLLSSILQDLDSGDQPDPSEWQELCRLVSTGVPVMDWYNNAEARQLVADILPYLYPRVRREELQPAASPSHLRDTVQKVLGNERVLAAIFLASQPADEGSC